ncbi:hypothetical protein T484DRAFT_1892312, partial [Baffinella frigidus]
MGTGGVVKRSSKVEKRRDRKKAKRAVQRLYKVQRLRQLRRRAVLVQRLRQLRRRAVLIREAFDALENRERGEEENTRESRDLKAELKVTLHEIVQLQRVTLHEIVQLQRVLGPGAENNRLDKEAESKVEAQATATLGLRGEGGASRTHSSSKVRETLRQVEELSLDQNRASAADTGKGKGSRKRGPNAAKTKAGEAAPDAALDGGGVEGDVDGRVNEVLTLESGACFDGGEARGPDTPLARPSCGRPGEILEEVRGLVTQLATKACDAGDIARFSRVLSDRAGVFLARGKQRWSARHLDKAKAALELAVYMASLSGNETRIGGSPPVLSIELAIELSLLLRDRLGDPAGALNVLRETVAASPLNARSLLALGRHLLHSPDGAVGSLDEASEVLRRASSVKGAPGEVSAEAFVSLSEALVRAGDAEEALSVLRRAAALQPDMPALRTRLALVYSICGSREEDADAETMRVALAHAGKDLSTNWSAEVWALKSREHFARTEMTKAKSAAWHAVALAPHNLLCIIAHARCEEGGVDNIGAWRRAVRLGRRSQEAAAGLGKALEAQDQADTAMEVYERCLAARGDNESPTLHLRIGACLYNHLQEAAEAEEHLLRSLACVAASSPGSSGGSLGRSSGGRSAGVSEALFVLGSIAEDAEGEQAIQDSSKALDLYRRAIAADPNNVPALVGCADILASPEQSPDADAEAEAAGLYERAAALSPADACTLRNWGRLLERAADVEATKAEGGGRGG